MPADLILLSKIFLCLAFFYLFILFCLSALWDWARLVRVSAKRQSSMKLALSSIFLPGGSEQNLLAVLTHLSLLWKNYLLLHCEVWLHVVYSRNLYIDHELRNQWNPSVEIYTCTNHWFPVPLFYIIGIILSTRNQMHWQNCT